MDSKETRGLTINTPPTQNTRLLVNFSTRQVVTTKFHRGSKEWQALLKKGYEEIAILKPDKGIYVLPDFFNFGDSYPSP